ncbi:MAG: PIN domain nuclease [Chloroflexi bacterium]|nr:PIN domain nuclease [Chloroflexota bacterium]MCL5074980.1 PIN domain nuclease [Chloroflexota bacterium]
MKIDLIVRILGAVTLGYLGWSFGGSITPEIIQGQQIILGLIFGILGLGIGLALTPYATIRPTLWLLERAHRVSAQELLAATIGLLIGLIISALLAIPLSMLPSFLGKVLPLAATVVFSYLGISVMVMRKREIFALLTSPWQLLMEGRQSSSSEQVLIDTSAIIDGRIADISQTGFIGGTLMVPRFVLNELQHIADSPDALRRNRGRRGLDMLNRLQKESLVPIKIIDSEVDGSGDVDNRLVKLAKQFRCPIITNDYNLNRVAGLQGVRVLNINELANAVKSVVLPGEEMTIQLIQEGKEIGQGVGYLDDGTMVVVEDGRKHLNTEVEVVVTRVLQTVAGRMIFAHLKGE